MNMNTTTDISATYTHDDATDDASSNGTHSEDQNVIIPVAVAARELLTYKVSFFKN